MLKPHGIIPALVTPLDEKGNLIEESLKNIIDFTIDAGVHGVFVLGTTGEFYGLDYNQKKRIIELTVEYTAGRVPVYAGASEITTDNCIKLTNLAENIGVDAVSVLTSFFIRPSQDELFDHYLNIAKSTKLPVILYSNVGRTNVNISPNLTAKLADIESIVGIKDSGGSLTQTAQYINQTIDKDFNVIAGRDTQILATLVYGGKGSIAATANIVPDIVVGIYNSFIAGNIEKARQYQYKLSPLRAAFELGTFPAVVKEAMKIIGIDAGVTFKPVGPLSNDNYEKLKDIITNLEIIDRCQ